MLYPCQFDETPLSGSTDILHTRTDLDKKQHALSNPGGVPY